MRWRAGGLVSLLLLMAGRSEAWKIRPQDLPHCEGTTGFLPEFNGCKLIRETPSYKLYWNVGHWGNGCVLMPRDRLKAYLSLVFKGVAKESAVVVDDAYKMRVEKEILPIIDKQKCRTGSLDEIVISHYVDGFLIPRGGGRIRALPLGPAEQYTEASHLSSLQIKMAKGKPAYGEVWSILGGTGRTSLAAVEKARDQQERDKERSRQEKAREEKARQAAQFKNAVQAFKELGKMLEPVTKALDQREEAGLEESGVVYRQDATTAPGQHNFSICNQSGGEVRLASALRYASRAAIFDTNIPAEWVVRGWARLPEGQCRTVRAGVGNLVFLRIETLVKGEWSGDRSWTTDADAETVDLTAITSRFLSSEKARFCAAPSAYFNLRSSETSVEECTGGHRKMTFPYVVQFGSQTHYTVTLK